jgi:hypothetical protein
MPNEAEISSLNHPPLFCLDMPKKKKNNVRVLSNVMYLSKMGNARCCLNCDVTFKITVRFEIIIIYFLSIGDFKSYITVGRTL